MKTKCISILMACFFLTGLIPFTSAEVSADFNTTDKIKLFNTLSDGEGEAALQRKALSPEKEEISVKKAPAKAILQPESRIERILSANSRMTFHESSNNTGMIFFKTAPSALSLTPIFPWVRITSSAPVILSKFISGENSKTITMLP